MQNMSKQQREVCYLKNNCFILLICIAPMYSTELYRDCYHWPWFLSHNLNSKLSYQYVFGAWNWSIWRKLTQTQKNMETICRCYPWPKLKKGPHRLKVAVLTTMASLCSLMSRNLMFFPFQTPPHFLNTNSPFWCSNSVLLLLLKYCACNAARCPGSN